MARPLVEGLDGLAASFREQVRGLDAGELNVAAGSSTILYLLPGIVDAFRQRHADVRLSLHNVTGASGLDLLRNDAVDLAVGSMLDVPADSHRRAIWTLQQGVHAGHGGWGVRCAGRPRPATGIHGRHHR